jgi:hypothetical protein
MKTQTALSLAIQAMSKESHNLKLGGFKPHQRSARPQRRSANVQANLANHFGLDTPAGRSASKHKADLEAAIIVLQDLKDVLKVINYAG